MNKQKWFSIVNSNDKKYIRESVLTSFMEWFGAKDDNNYTLLDLSVIRKNLYLLELLLTLHYEINNSDGIYKAFAIAMTKLTGQNRNTIIKVFLNKSKIFADVKFCDALPIAVKNRQNDVAISLIKKGCDVMKKDKDGFSSLDYIIQNDDVQLWSKLIDKIQFNEDSLITAIRLNRKDMIKTMLKYDIEISPLTFITAAKYTTDKNIFANIVRYVRMKNETFLSPCVLIDAIIADNLMTVMYMVEILKYGTEYTCSGDINYIDPVDTAIKNNKFRILKYLIKSGVQYNIDLDITSLSILKQLVAVGLELNPDSLNSLLSRAIVYNNIDMILYLLNIAGQNIVINNGNLYDLYLMSKRNHSIAMALSMQDVFPLVKKNLLQDIYHMQDQYDISIQYFDLLSDPKMIEIFINSLNTNIDPKLILGRKDIITMIYALLMYLPSVSREQIIEAFETIAAKV